MSASGKRAERRAGLANIRYAELGRRLKGYYEQKDSKYVQEHKKKLFWVLGRIRVTEEEMARVAKGIK